MKQIDPKSINTTMLAYLGDAVYEVFIREKIVHEQPHDAGRAHHRAVRYVSADGQAKAVKAMESAGFLTDEELALYKRARNHRTMSRPQHTDPKTYKMATGFEAILGYLHLKGDPARIKEIAEEAVNIIDSVQ